MDQARSTSGFKLVFYRTLDVAGKSQAVRVLTVETPPKSPPTGQDRRQLHVLQTRLAHWRQFADFFEIIRPERLR